MKVLHVIHGYPPYYMAGSEVYTFTLTKELSKHVDVFVFTRIENHFEPPYSFFEEKYKKIRIRRVNKPNRDYTYMDKYIDPKMDDAFRDYLNLVNPDIVHISHLSHLSTNIINVIKEELDIPIVFTLHDFWLLCVRGQLITPQLNLCDGPSIEKCLACAKYYFKYTVDKKDIIQKFKHMERITRKVDVFLSPSKFLIEIFVKNGYPKEKLIFSPYGFDKDLITYKSRKYSKNSKITFGFIGRIIPTKGIHILLKAFRNLKNKNARLLIFGDAGSHLRYLKQYSDERVEFMGGFNHHRINEILEKIDVLVVPSIWYENSPLVIQEAFLAGVPVVTSNLGGMAELVKDNENGFLFEVGNIDALKNRLSYIMENPEILNYVKPKRCAVRDISDDAKFIFMLYKKLINGETPQ